MGDQPSQPGKITLGHAVPDPLAQGGQAAAFFHLTLHVSPTYSLHRSTNGYYNRRLANFYAKVNSTNQWCGGGVVYFRRLRDLREDRDLKQTDVAALLGIRQTVYSRYERGYQNLPLEHLLALADYYGVSTDYILGRTDNPKTNP